MRQIEIPLSYQPVVGEHIEAIIGGRVVAVSIDPMAPSGEGIIVTIDVSGVGNQDDPMNIEHFNSHRGLRPMATGGGGT